MRTLTNARLYNKDQLDGPKNGMMMKIQCSPSIQHLLFCLLVAVGHIVLVFPSSDINTTWLSSFLSFMAFSETLNVETYWSHWMDFTESLLWFDTNIR